MAVGLKVGPIFYKIGTGSFLNCFFSTVIYNLEASERGSRFPYLMGNLYGGELSYKDIPLAQKELEQIKSELESFPPNKVIWDIDYPDQTPPWRDNIADKITNLSNYFYTSDGEDLFELFTRALKAAKEIERDVIISSL